VTRDSHHCTCLGHFGRCYTDRIISIYGVRPMQASSDCRVSLLRVTVVGIMALTFANVNDPILSSIDIDVMFLGDS
jgi:hypothetical protein